MQQLTVKELHEETKRLIKKGYGDKLIIISDDVEGNGYHGLLMGFTSNPLVVKECIKASNGISDSETENKEELIILG